ncbi:hypothetical protein [Halarcobacter sp.]|uniref:hypothetical protein n=1 Tax=Halarcobacter sp. TaxID=2321133 RepID=UPI0029F59F5F|nr:hypothetical protein [Halarcobacter sp.]
MDKIIDIPKMKKQLNEINKVNNKQLSLEHKKLKEKYLEVLMLPDKFNTYFSNDCWIAFDSFDDKVMKDAIERYEKHKSIEMIDEFFSDIYNENFINTFIDQITCFKNCHLDNLPNVGTLFIKYFLDRIEIIEIAKEDYLNERYYSCIPLLLSAIDGITNDIDHEFGFFTKHADMIIEDSIVGHQTGLQVIQKIVNQARKTTSLEPITIPYRNGILHGRDVNYGNKIVAAKCWNILCALRDWAKDNNKKNFTVENRNPITKEDIDSIVSNDFDIFIDNLFEKLKDSRNHELIFFCKYPTNIYSKYHRMKELSRLFKDIKFLDFKIIHKEEYQNNLKSLNIEITYKYLEEELNKQINISVEYSDIDNKLVSTKNKNGHWKLNFLESFNTLRM